MFMLFSLPPLEAIRAKVPALGEEGIVMFYGTTVMSKHLGAKVHRSIVTHNIVVIARMPTVERKAAWLGKLVFMVSFLW